MGRRRSRRSWSGDGAGGDDELLLAEFWRPAIRRKRFAWGNPFGFTRVAGDFVGKVAGGGGDDDVKVADLVADLDLPELAGCLASPTGPPLGGVKPSWG